MMPPGVRGAVRRVMAALRRGPEPVAPLGGYLEHRDEIALVDGLSDAELAELNGLLPWRAFTVDRHGRRFGGVAWKGKREQPQAVPDRRIRLMHERFGLAGRSVLEVGCFEGIHTVGLARVGAHVIAVDGRVENVVKTIVRAACYGCAPRVFVYDVEQAPARVDLLGADFIHHVGVLYHLRDPVRHLLELGRYIASGVMLDTHYAGDGRSTSSYEVDGVPYRYQPYRELGLTDPFSGLYAESRWLPLETIVALLRQSGFDRVDVAERREERNGPRALVFASRA